MCFKKCLTNVLIRIYLHLKNLKILFFIPLFIINVLIPFLNYIEYTQHGIGNELYMSILEYSQWLMPFVSVWWSLFALRDYIENDGNELLYVHKASQQFIDIFLLFFLCILNITVIFSVYTLLIPSMKYEYVRILSICIFYFGIMFFLSILTKSTTIALLVVILYTIANICYRAGNENIVLLYFSTARISNKLFYSNYLPLLLNGILFTAIGALINTKKIRTHRYI